MKKKYIIIISSSIILATIMIVLITIFIKNKSKWRYELEVVNEINYMIFSENNKFGVINKNGDIVVQSRYDEIQIPNPSKPLFICMYDYNNEKNQYNVKVLNENSEQILYQYVVVEAIKLNSDTSEIPYEKSVLKYKQNDKYGLIDFKGNVIVKAKYEEISSLAYKEGLLVVKKDGKYGVININGATVVKENYDIIESDGYYEDGSNYDKLGFIVGQKVNDAYKYGYINFKGKKILDLKYNQIGRIQNINKNDDVYLVAFENEKAGFYINNENIIKNDYEDIEYDSNNNCLILQQNSKQGISDLSGNMIIDIQYDNIYISGKYINAQKNMQIDIYDYNTNKKINFENVVGLNETTNDNYSIAITKDEKYKILDNQKNELKDNEYDYLEFLYDNYFIAGKFQENMNTQQNEYTNNMMKYGIIDIDGNELVDFKYDFLQKIGNTKIVQALDITQDITDLILENKVITSMENCKVYLEESYILMQSMLDMKYVGFDGHILENTNLFSKELYSYKQNDKWGFVNKNGEIIINTDYDFVTEFNDYGFAGIKKDEKWGVVNLKGEIVLEPTYIINSNSPEFIGKYYKYNLGYGEPYYICKDIS